MSRLEDLRELRESLRERMRSCDSDQNFAVMGRLLADVVKQIDEIKPASSGEVTGLSEFEKALAERRSGAAGSRRSKSG